MSSVSSSTTSAGVSVRGLRIRFGANEVIPGLDLEIEPGEFLVLLGPSGCGKSTLLHAIAGLQEVADGQLLIGGRDMTWADPKDRGVGMVFQSYALYPTMSVERNMSFGLRVAGLPKAEIERRVQRAAQMLQLGPLLARKPAQLSGGQRQRVAIGRALVREAGVFLFDEPLSNLDAQLRTELRRELKLLHRTLGSTMVYVTHDQVEAMTLADRIVVMRGGRIQQVGAPGEVYERPANRFVAGFLGAPGMNFVPGVFNASAPGAQFEAPGWRVDLQGYRFAAAAPGAGAPMVMGVRPEQLRIAADGPVAGKVQLIEPMGNHQVVWVDVAGQAVAVLDHAALPLATDQPLRLALAADRLSLFDPDTGARL
ncbi:ABC transporter ATP-binding protein [Ideonella sp. DXS22W]|uniref:ABC transporter ATP-binding protein n=1 Tax=Pseudaquabacterium inlustre TaxID=2984192 RepID=A0ABU9CMY1_9BURK